MCFFFIVVPPEILNRVETLKASSHHISQATQLLFFKKWDSSKTRHSSFLKKIITETLPF